MTVRSALSPRFGGRLSGIGGPVADPSDVAATIHGVAQTPGVGGEQVVARLQRVGVGTRSVAADGKPGTAGIVLALAVILRAATLCSRSGVGEGIRRQSNLDMGLGLVLPAFFIRFGSTFFGLTALFSGLVA